MAARPHRPRPCRDAQPVQLRFDDRAERSADAANSDDGDALRPDFPHHPAGSYPVKLRIERIIGEAFRDGDFDLFREVDSAPLAVAQRAQNGQVRIVLRAERIGYARLELSQFHLPLEAMGRCNAVEHGGRADAAPLFAVHDHATRSVNALAWISSFRLMRSRAPQRYL